MLRAVWFVIGAVAMVLGIIGLFLPLLPTTPFLLLAAFCFARSSPRVEMWLVEHPRLGPPIRDWRREGAIAPRAKMLALGMIGATFALSLILGLPTRVLLIQAVVLGAVTLFIATRPTPR